MTSGPEPEMTEHRPTRPVPLSAREGRRARPALHEGVPQHLRRPLTEWTREYLDRDVEERMALMLDVELSPRYGARAETDPPRRLLEHPDVDLLDVVDLALQTKGAITHEPIDPNVVLDPGHEGIQAIEMKRVSRIPLDRLSRLLDEAGSVYRVDRRDHPPRLMRRADPTTEAALDQALDDAEPTAAERLREAWTAAYARDPDPNTAYLNAVRAVETQIDTDGVVCPDHPGPTLGTMVRDLRQGERKFEIVLLDRDGDGSVTPLVEMLERLWRGNVCRHGGRVYRDQTLAEARAAVQLAVVCVQWLADGVLRRRDISGPS